MPARWCPGGACQGVVGYGCPGEAQEKIWELLEVPSQIKEIKEHLRIARQRHKDLYVQDVQFLLDTIEQLQEQLELARAGLLFIPASELLRRGVG